MNEILWHRIAAIAFVLRLLLFIPLTVGLADSTNALVFLIGVNGLLAIGYWLKKPLAYRFGIYAAIYSVVYPWVLPGVSPDQWLIINTIYSVALVAIAIVAWRTRHQSTQT